MRWIHTKWYSWIMIFADFKFPRASNSSSSSISERKSFIFVRSLPFMMIRIIWLGFLLLYHLMTLKLYTTTVELNYSSCINNNNLKFVRVPWEWECQLWMSLTVCIKITQIEKNWKHRKLIKLTTVFGCWVTRLMYNFETINFENYKIAINF
jgi:hypothetical protein